MQNTDDAVGLAHAIEQLEARHAELQEALFKTQYTLSLIISALSEARKQVAALVSAYQVKGN